MKKTDTTGPPTNSNWGGACLKKITQKASNVLSEWVSGRPDMTLQGLCDKLQGELSISVSKQTVSKALTDIGFTVKLTRPIPLSRNCPSLYKHEWNMLRSFLQKHLLIAGM
jgi:transposase